MQQALHQHQDLSDPYRNPWSDPYTHQPDNEACDAGSDVSTASVGVGGYGAIVSFDWGHEKYGDWDVSTLDTDGADNNEEPHYADDTANEESGEVKNVMLMK